MNDNSEKTQIFDDKMKNEIKAKLFLAHSFINRF